MLDLNKAAVSCLKGQEAGEVLQAYLATGPEMVFAHTASAGLQEKPQGTGAGDKLVKPR